MMKASLSVLTLNDTFCEEDEYLKVTLTLNQIPCMVEVGPDLAFVSITPGEIL